jgi:hypothetical protein
VLNSIVLNSMDTRRRTVPAPRSREHPLVIVRARWIARLRRAQGGYRCDVVPAVTSALRCLGVNARPHRAARVVS